MHLHAVHRESGGHSLLDARHTSAISSDYSCMAYALQCSTSDWDSEARPHDPLVLILIQPGFRIFFASVWVTTIERF